MLEGDPEQGYGSFASGGGVFFIVDDNFEAEYINFGAMEGFAGEVPKIFNSSLGHRSSCYEGGTRWKDHGTGDGGQGAMVRHGPGEGHMGVATQDATKTTVKFGG